MMDDWSKEFFNLLETVTTEIEQLFQEMGDVVDDVTQEIQENLAADFDRCLDEFDDLCDRVVSQYIDFEGMHSEFIDPEYDSYNIKPAPDKPSACMGCRNYHGQMYGGNRLVCAMHPYGWEDSPCPDWEK
ncbi:hypothetical protein IQ249_18335 [Lusitaniella coriacea LEGE 07157]|uniref:Uncharacterized protein n=1 Tax=Lusitaniella coriacea LEGE 07157 TaxID=945747 RepID=A0A8J7DYJ5_9CYAN|nr:hypothetical protein [Lusitaniella coriacea]MBE9117861.1 hypothetical protein [Lusitaniella coriacea LEGE 07157]